jgi:hypothetical protein
LTERERNTNTESREIDTHRHRDTERQRQTEKHRERKTKFKLIVFIYFGNFLKTLPMIIFSPEIFFLVIFYLSLLLGSRQPSFLIIIKIEFTDETLLPLY